MADASVKTDPRTYKVSKMKNQCGGYELKIDRIQADRGTTIRWEAATDHIVSIWFPDAGVFYSPVIAVQHKGVVEATIRRDAKDGLYEYAIYDHTEREFVTCESHPKIEIPIPRP